MGAFGNAELSVFLVLFVPGFVSMKIYDLLIPGQRRNFSDDVFQAVGFGCLNFVALSWLILPAAASGFQSMKPVLAGLLLTTVFLVGPLLWPVILVCLLNWDPVAKRAVRPISRAWDWVFRSKRQAEWVIIHLRDGRSVAGKYGRKSYVSSFGARVDRTKGMVVLGSDILAVEFFD